MSVRSQGWDSPPRNAPPKGSLRRRYGIDRGSRYAIAFPIGSHLWNGHPACIIPRRASCLYHTQAGRMPALLIFIDSAMT
ncbi:MAG: hypothetical protein F6J90_41545 [Moorea sp. SIOASIH]|uniref:hypothetical protein n=1 Tax=Moorena sp. SIOASIH TaxID=2607817 RepID=UPI0013BCE498|nr:hypothetical protein [Moorena sp. SIOASIH]NEO42460.1 hypothetical protein [Moorena sp. SIOASIH]